MLTWSRIEDGCVIKPMMTEA